MHQSSEIKLKIQSTFAHVKRLPDAAMFLDEFDYLWVESFIGGNEEWHELSSYAISSETGALRSVTPLGFQFLIPAYICWLLDNPKDESSSADNLIYALNASTHSPEAFEIFTTEQSEAICEFLVWAAAQNDLDHVEAEKSLNSYWNSFKRNT